MLNCRFDIEINGYTKSFDSQEDLDNFINNNYDRIVSSESTEGVRFSKEISPKLTALGKIAAIRAENADLTATYDEFGNKKENINEERTAKGYMGVTKKIDSMTEDGSGEGKKLIQPFIQVDYVNSQLQREIDTLKGDPLNNGLSGLALKEIALTNIHDRIKGWKVLGQMGTDLHDVAQMFFRDKITDPEEMLLKYDKPLTLELMTKYVGYLENIKQDMISKSGDPDMTFFSELAVHDPISKVVGIIDLVGIDSNGISYLADFKTAFKSIDAWDSAKLKKATYQLSFYQQLMMSKGLAVGELTIYPIYLEEVDVKKKEIGNVRLEEPVNLKSELYTTKTKVLSDVSGIIPVDITPFITFKSDSNITAQMQKMFNMTSGFDNIEQQVETFKKDSVKETEGMKWFYDAIKGERTELKGSVLDQEDQIREYIKKTVELTIQRTNVRKSALKKFMSATNPEYKNLVDRGKEERKDVLRQAYARYCDGTWSILEAAELEQFGIIGFRDLYSGVIEFVIDTPLNLNDVRKLSKGTSVLGEFYSDHLLQSKDIQLPKLPANVGNLEAMRILMWFNTNADQLKANNSSLGNIRAINTTDTNMGMVGVEVDKLVANYLKLMERTNLEGAGIVNNFDKIKYATYEDLLHSQIVHLLKEEKLTMDERSKAESIRTTFDEPDVTAQLAKLIAIQKKWIQDKGLRPEKIDLDSKAGYLFSLLNATIAGMQGIKIRYEQDINNTSLNRSSNLSTPFELEAESIIYAAQFPIKQAMQAMSNSYVEFNGGMRKKFDKFYKNNNVSIIAGDHLRAFDHLFERDAKGNITKDFMFRNPFDMSNNLSTADREFLTDVLEKINAVIHPNANTDELKRTGEYFQVPLMRASDVSRSHNSNWLEAIKDKYDNITNFHLLFEEDQQANLAASEQMLEIHNAFRTTTQGRKQRLQDKKIAEFDTNIELILAELVFSDIRKKTYDQILPTVFAVRVASRMVNAGFINNPLPNMDQHIKDWVKISVFNEKILEPAHEGIAKKIGAFRSGVTLLQLAGTPLNLVKETIQGQSNNLIKLLAGQYGKAGASAADYKWAVSYIIGEGKDFINNVTMVEELNHMYRMANMDTHQLAEKMKLSKTGMTQFHSRWLLWASGAPDYINRMSLFLAQMKKDGSIDAHTMVDGILTYDWKKDGRFKIYASGNKAAPEYGKQRSLYLRIMEEHNNDSRTLGKPLLVEGDALPRAYTTKEQQSFKMFSDYIHGPYDHEGKIKLNHMLLGGLFIQFKTWLSAKKQQYTMKGDVYAIGSWEHYKDVDGKLWYIKEDADGNREPTLEVTNEPYMEWKGRYMEGVWQSMLRTYGEFKKSEYSLPHLVNFLKQDDTVKGNFKMMSFDLMLFTIMSIAIKGMIDWDDLKKDEPFMAALLKSAVNATSDLSPYANIKAAVDPKALTATISTVTQTVENTMGAITGDKSVMSLVRNAGIGRTFDDLTNFGSAQDR